MRTAQARERDRFLLLVENEIVIFLGEFPRYRAFEEIQGQLEKLDGAAKVYAARIAGLNQEAVAYLKQGFFMNAHRSGSADARGAAATVIDDLIISGAVAAEAAKTADRLLRGMKNKPTVAKRQNEFVLATARAYGRAFGWRASYSKTGSFAKLLPRMLQEAGISRKIAEDGLRTLLARERLPGRPPKRGPKPR
jgi:hypothetical protein